MGEIMKCQAFENREVTFEECNNNRKELPEKYCKGCYWYGPVNPTENVMSPKPVPPTYVPSTYTIRLSNKLKNMLIKEAKEKGVQPREYIVKVLSEKLIENF